MAILHKTKSSILIIGPKPPPHHGVSVATEKLLGYDVRNILDVYHVDLADRRGIQHVDKPDLYDVALFFSQFIKSINIVISKRPSIAYLPISQTTVGFLRDSFFILLCLVGGCRVILHLHGGDFRNWYEQRRRIFRTFIKAILSSIDVMIVLSESFKKLFDGLIPHQKIAVVPNGVSIFSTKKDKNDKHQKMSLRELTVLYLGTLYRLKGVLVLLNSIPLVIREQPDIRFVFAGPWFDKRDREEAEAFIASRGITHAVHFPGAVEGQTKWDVLKTSDIFVFPGIQQEGQPLVVLEAMAAGLPIIYTNRGCLSDIVLDGYNGFEVRRNDPKDIADKILLLTENPRMLKEMGQRNREKYKNNYTDKHYISNMLKVFRHISKKSDLLREN